MPSRSPLRPIFDPGVSYGTVNPGHQIGDLSFPGAVVFTYTGSVQSWVVPAGRYLIEVETNAAQGGSVISGAQPFKAGGLGQSIVSRHVVTPGQTVYVYVGGQPSDHSPGWPNGGGDNGQGLASSGKGGGGRSEVRVGTNTLGARVVCAGAGAGAGAGHANGRTNAAGGYGGSVPTDGENGQTTPTGKGLAATSIAGGVGGTGDNNWASDEGGNGAANQGGYAGSFHGGSGGDGIFGGGGGGGGLGPSGGGGGYGALVSGVLISSADGVWSGNGEVTIHY